MGFKRDQVVPLFPSLTQPESTTESFHHKFALSALTAGAAAPRVMVDVGEIRKEGWVNKESAVIRTYRKRWMVLTPERLYSFKGEKKYTVRSRLLGTPYPYPYPYSHPCP